ncbi:MAG: peptidylprolyl isomerase [Pirellulaceae bacterium]
MLRRFFVVSLVLMALGLWLSGPRLSTAQEAPAPDAAQEAPAPDAAQAASAPDAAQAAPAPDAAATDAAQAPQPDPQQVRAEFDAKFNEWKELLKRLRTLKHEYQLADDATRTALEAQWAEGVAKVNEFLPTLTAAAADAYRAAPNEDRELTSFLVKMLQDHVAYDRYESAAALGDILIEGQCDMPQIYQAAAMANFALNNLDKTLSLLDQAEANDAFDGDLQEMRRVVTEYVAYWEREQELRAKEAAADDLPRVKLTTNKGEIVLELFENEAPETVGNFVSLVEKGFYDGLTFHRVLYGFMAQGGCPEGDGSGGPGYVIYDEQQKPEARKHFRGSLSMAKTNAPNSGGSQFFITFQPTPNLNGLHTVFGRVIEGMNVVDQLQRRQPDKEDAPDPDVIEKAEVVRKRNHEYLPHKVE